MNTKIMATLDKPQILLDYLTGYHPFYSYMCLKMRDLEKHIKTILDVGAHEGLFINSFKKYFPNTNIIAFEPTKECIPHLINKKVKVFNIALGKKNITKPFYYLGRNSGRNSFLKLSSSFLKLTMEKEKEKRNLQIKRFDNLNIKIIRPCLLKIDVEGMEADVLEGFGKELKKVDIVCLEYNVENNFEKQSKLKDLVEKLDKAGLTKMKSLLENARNTDLCFYR